MSWLWSNKEWLFSGIGVAVVVWLLSQFLRQRLTSPSSTVSANQNSSILGSPVARGSNISQTVTITQIGDGQATSAPVKTYSSSPTPTEIEDQLSSLPLYQRKGAAKSYLGLDVSWPARLFHLQEMPKYSSRRTGATHNLSLMFGEKQIGLPQVSAEINIERFPRLKISHQGTPLQISGTISRVSELGRVELSDVDIEF